MNFYAERWAESFLDAAGSDYKTALEIVKSFCQASAALKAPPIGKTQAQRAVKSLNAAINSASGGDLDGKEKAIAAAEAIIYLILERGYFNKLALFLCTATELAERRAGVLQVTLETAVKPDEAMLSELRKNLLLRNNARDVHFTIKENPRLIAGFSLLIDTVREDYSLLGRLSSFGIERV